MRRDELGVVRDGEVHHLQEEGFGGGGHGDGGGGARKPRCIQGRAENCNLAGRRSEGLEAFVALLAVVEARSHAVDWDVGGGDKAGGCPLLCVHRVRRRHVAIDFADFEADVCPIYGGQRGAQAGIGRRGVANRWRRWGLAGKTWLRTW